MINTCLLPTSYLPAIEYFYYLVNSDKIVIEQYETFPKQTYRNRTFIYTDKGKTLLSIPVTKPDGNRSITKDIKICYKENWIQKHWRAIESAYNPSPFFLYYKDPIRRILEKKNEYLIDLNTELLEFFLQKLKLQATIEYSSRFYKDIEESFDLNMLENLKNATFFKMPSYHQVFSDKYGFIQNLSILDLLFNKGPEAGTYILSLNKR